MGWRLGGWRESKDPGLEGFYPKRVSVLASKQMKNTYLLMLSYSIARVGRGFSGCVDVVEHR